MKVVIAAVISIDGKLTKHDDSNLDSWVSDEDQMHFKALIAEHDAIVIGRKTYELSQGKLNPEKAKLKIVLTSNPEKFASHEVAGQLLFRKDTPQELIDFLTSQGYEKLLVAGGERIITEFLQARLVDEIYLTIEPRLFGQGVKLIATEQLDIKLQLMDYGKLNEQGTLLLRYKIL